MPTLGQVRAAVGELADPEFLASVATGGSTTTLVDTVALIRATADTRYKYGFILRNAKTNTDRRRVISGDVASTGTLTVPNAWLAGVAAADAYEVWAALDPVYVVERAINRALRRLKVSEEVAITGVDSQLQYDLSAYTWLVSRQQFRGVSLRVGTTAARYAYAEMGGAWLSQDEGTITLNLPQAVGTSDTLILRATRDYQGIGALVAEADVTACPLQLAAWATVLELLRTPTTAHLGLLDQLDVDKEEARVQALFEEVSAAYQTNDSAPLFKSDGVGWQPLPTFGGSRW